MYINREIALPACLAGSFVWKCKQAKIASGNFSIKGIWLLVSTLFLGVKAASIFVKYYPLHITEYAMIFFLSEWMG